MKIVKRSLNGLHVFELDVYNDNRGYFMETFRENDIQNKIKKSIHFVQDNESRSTKGVIRGLHYQIPPMAQSKLVRVVHGTIWDVVVDLRKNSPSFGKTLCMELSEVNKKLLFIPKGFAHGYITLSDTATILYKVDNYYSKAHEASITFNDKDLAIPWPLSPDEWILSQKDKQLQTFKEAFYF